MRRSSGPSSSSGMDLRMEGILHALVNVGALLESQAEQQACGENRVQGLVEQFLKLKPPTFVGIGNLEDTEQWIEKMERIFNLPICNDADKIILAKYQLEGNAKH